MNCCYMCLINELHWFDSGHVLLSTFCRLWNLIGERVVRYGAERASATRVVIDHAKKAQKPDFQNY